MNLINHKMEENKKKVLKFENSDKVRKTLELFKNSDTDYLIEVDDIENDEVDHIGILTEDDNPMFIIDYDGVFFVDEDEILFLQECGFDTTEIE